jgi:hypothetical protein
VGLIKAGKGLKRNEMRYNSIISNSNSLIVFSRIQQVTHRGTAEKNGQQDSFPAADDP